MGDNRIIKNIETLREDYVPPYLVGREKEIKELQLCLAPVLRRRKPINAWLYSKPGTGKTAVAKYVLDQLQEQSQVQGIYVNCWEHDSLYSVIDKLVRDLKIMFAERQDTNLKLQRLRDTVGNKPLVVVLDEIDKPSPKERNAILYNLSAIGNLGLICICNSRSFLLDLDERTLSRLSPRQIGLSPYPSQVLTDILGMRAEHSLEASCLAVQTLERIAELSEGDARIAIQMLKNAAEMAESSNSNKISDGHIDAAWSVVKELKKKYLLERLGDHHKMIHTIIGEQPGSSSGQIWVAYIRVCEQAGKRPVAARTFSAYLSKLTSLGLVHAEYSGRNVRVFRAL